MFNLFKKSDARIEQDVMDEVSWDPSLNANQITASVKDGIVSLRGSVPHYFEKSRAEAAAQRVSGVRAVVDQVEVNMMGSYLRSDEQIANATLSVLQASYSSPKDIKVTVENGWVTLNGESEWNFQRMSADHLVTQLMGVRGLTNNISITSAVQPSDVKANIEDALKRSAESESQRVLVSVEGDKVVLSGSVDSLSDLRDVQEAVWMAPGVRSVESQLFVGHLG
jgi:osmotically-inducible protein OsmY